MQRTTAIFPFILKLTAITWIAAFSISASAEMPSYDSLEHQPDALKLARLKEAKAQICASPSPSLPSQAASPASASRSCDCHDANLQSLCSTQNKINDLQTPLDKAVRLAQLKREISYLESKTYFGRLIEAMTTLKKLNAKLEEKNDPKSKEQIATNLMYIKIYQDQYTQKKAEHDAAEREEEKKNAANGSLDESARLESKLKKLEEQMRQEYQSEVQKAGNPTCGMSLAEILALRDYAGSGFSDINSALREGGSRAELYTSFRDVLNSALEKLHPYEGYVLRGTNLPDTAKVQYAENAVVDSAAFTSSSITRGFSGRDRFVILSHKGRFISSLLSRDVEDEVLFPANTKFKVISVKPGLNGGNDYALEEVVN